MDYYLSVMIYNISYIKYLNMMLLNSFTFPSAPGIPRSPGGPDFPGGPGLPIDPLTP